MNIEEMKIKEQWESYVRQVLPETAGPVQCQETRRAFYAGAQALLSILTAGTSDDAEVTESDMSLLEGIQRELEQFYRDVQGGRA